MIDRTEHDIKAESKKSRATVDDDPRSEHSLDPNEHYGQQSDVPTEDPEADTAGD